METFKDLNLSPALNSAIEELGYTAPTPIQAQTLPMLLEGPTDFLGLAATGTGKTAAFGIPLLEQLDATKRGVQALILCPTRELALQVTEQINLLGKYKKIRAVPVYGGAGYGDQIRGLKQGAQIVVATPGRLIDHLERGTIQLDNVQTVILDEADEMISMGFKDELESILETMPSDNYKTWLFSATMSKDVRKVADRFLDKPKMVQVNKTEMLSGTVRQIYYKVKESDKADILCKLIDAAEEEFYGLIFCQTKSLVMDLTALLSSRGYKVDCLHGDKDQSQRERTMRAFRERRVSVVVCTDVASRGLDVKDLTHVVNYSIPRELDNYVHRIGRTGRSGKPGLALSLVTPSHIGLIRRIEQMTKSTVEIGTIPTRKDIGMKKTAQLLERFQAVTTHARVEELLSDGWVTALEGMSKKEIAARLLVLTFPEVFVDSEKTQMKMPGNPRNEGRSEGRSEGRPVGRTDRRDYSNEPQRAFVKPLDKPMAPGESPRGGWSWDRPSSREERPRAARSYNREERGERNFDSPGAKKTHRFDRREKPARSRPW